MGDNGNFDFQAPQFLESISDAASLAEKDGADSFFDTVSSQPLISPLTPQNKGIPEMFYTPLTVLPAKNNKEGMQESANNPANVVDTDEEDKENEEPISKDVNSSKNVINLKTSVKREQKKIFDGIEVVPLTSIVKEHKMETRQDKFLKTPTLELRTRPVVRKAMLKRKASPIIDEAPVIKKQATKFMSLAEKIMHFQVDTPPRFKSKFILLQGKQNRNVTLKKPTIPYSPNLKTKSRIRPIGNLKPEVPEKEQFKASKLNLKIVEMPNNNNTERYKSRKSYTVPKPFKLTEVSVKKEEPPKEKIFQFKARPAPKWLNSATSISSKSSICSTDQRRSRNPLSSLKIGQSLQEEEDTDAYSGMKILKGCNLPTQIKPFSFDERDKEMFRKKEEKLKQLQNSEKVVFKAKSPSVLRKKPFVPQKQEKCSILSVNITLNTQKRAQGRQEVKKN